MEGPDLRRSFAISVMMLPIVIRAADVVLRLVPGTLTEAAEALGAPRRRTVSHVVPPTARSGSGGGRHPRRGTRHRRNVPGPAHGGLHSSHELRPAARPDDLVATRGLQLRPLTGTGDDRPRFRRGGGY
ncbi:hypothetical protein ACRAWF_20600 [Streptomyces sp. L7]